MEVELPHIRIGLAAAAEAEPALVPRAPSLGCDTLYTYPKQTDKVDVTNEVTFKWDTKCQLDSEKIDLQLFQSNGVNKLLKQYQNVPFAKGEYSAQLSPTWWNNTETATLYVNILKAGGMSWDTSWPRGPDFNVTYDFSKFYSVTTQDGVPVTKAIGPGMGSTDTVYENADANASGGKGVSKAVIAVAVVIPIVVICLLAGVAFVFYRRREKKSLQRWSHALSQASNMEWEKGALPGERLSSYTGGRPSTHYSTTTDRASKYGRGRPSMSSSGRPASSVMMENMAGTGAGPGGMRPYPSHGEYVEGPTRSSITLADGTTRQSRISFADGRVTRPSFSNERRHMPSGLAEASYATGSAIDDGQRSSPTVDPAVARGSMDELRDMEAIMLMRRSGHMPEHYDEGSSKDNDVEALDADEEAARNATSPPPGSVPTVAYGPDQMLAVYAQRGKVNASPVNTPAPPPGAASKSTSRPNPMKRLLSRKDVRAKSPTGPVPPVPPVPELPGSEVNMRNYTHLNQGTMSAAAMDQLPPPGPPRSGSALSDNDHYEDAYDDHTFRH